MRSGNRPYRISIQRNTPTQDPDSGAEVDSWAELAEVWAGKGYRSAKEGVSAGEVQAMRVLRFEILLSAVADVSPLDRIEYPVNSGVYYDVSEVNTIGFNEGLELFAAARSETPQ